MVAGPDRLATLCAEDFSSLRDRTFLVRWDDESLPPVSFELEGVKELRHSHGDRAAFAITLSEPITANFEQGTYQFSNSELGDLDIFIVPVEENDERRLYEAVFN